MLESWIGVRALDDGESLKGHSLEETRPAFHVSKIILAAAKDCWQM